MICFHLADLMSVWNLLREFRIRQVHMAVVLNEYGGTVGVCSCDTNYLFFINKSWTIGLCGPLHGGVLLVFVVPWWMVRRTTS
jgi:hypothetical protein